MKITIESTPKIVTLVVNGVEVPARIWQGETESGTPVQCFITRIAPEIPHADPRQREFEEQLTEHVTPRRTIDAIPLRMIL